tara:strand:- start:71 stop:529 length:459 start_codon:yes stop_codon:yes gene_type:complete
MNHILINSNKYKNNNLKDTNVTNNNLKDTNVTNNNLEDTNVTNNILENNLNKENITENIDVLDINNINTKLSLNNKKKIINLVKNLDENQRFEIYKLISNETNKFTKKTDGIIVDLNNLSDQCIYKIFCYIKYNEDNDNIDNINNINNITEI